MKTCFITKFYHTMHLMKTKSKDLSQDLNNRIVLKYDKGLVVTDLFPNF